MIDKEEQNISGIIGHLFRHEAGKMAAVLARKLGASSWEDIDDIIQDTLVRAMKTWKFKGLPNNPTAWLHKVAWHRAIDYVRNKKRDQKIDERETAVSVIEAFDFADNKDIQDSMLRMMFACCHPSIPVESQIAFVLKTLGGLTVKEISKSFMASEDTIAKRIYRAKEKFREEKIEIDAFPVYEISERLDVVLKVLYLLFNEGYYSANPEQFIREDLCEEAMRLAHLLLQNQFTNQPKVKALLALMCFQASRFLARVDENKNIVLLEYQDRSRWNVELVNQGFKFLSNSSKATRLSEYHVEASIASIHAMAKDFESTNWKELVHLYSVLEELKPGNFVSLNKAIAIGYAHSAADGIDALKKIKGLEGNQYYHVALGDFNLMLKNYASARHSYELAKALTKSTQELDLLNQKLKSCL